MIARVITISFLVAIGMLFPNCVKALPKEEIPFAIATYNINFDNQNLDKVIKAIDESKADIVCLQETTVISEQYLQKIFKTKYPYMKFQGYKGLYYAERFGFLSKYPLEKVAYLDPKFGLFGTYIAKVRLKGVLIQVVNVHLDPINVFKDRTFFGLLKAFTKANKAHLDETKRILEKLDKQIPTIIAGDFNGKSESSAANHLKEKGFSDSFAEVNKNPDKNPTWEWQLRTGKITARLDFIFHDTNFKTRKSMIIRNNSSDHFLVYSVLTLMKQKSGK